MQHHERTNNSTFQNADIYVEDGLALMKSRDQPYFTAINATFAKTEERDLQLR